VAFPSRTAVGTGSGSGATGTVTIPSAPSGTGANDIILAHYTHSLNGAGGPSISAGWTQLRVSNAAGRYLSTWYRRDDGTLGGATATVSHAGGDTEDFAWVCQRWAGCHTTTAPEASNAATVNFGSSVDPPSLDPAGWGTEDTTWTAICSGHTNRTITYPANYGSNNTKGGTSPFVGVCSRERNASSEDCGAFSFSGNVYGNAHVIALRPAAVTAKSQVIWAG
jgi:hypothetical protein